MTSTARVGDQLLALVEHRASGIRHRAEREIKSLDAAGYHLTV
jgi:hypothetical protein